jgi:hypothetical protein
MNAVRPMAAVLLSLAGLVVWAVHFTAIYMITAVACERALVGHTLLGVPLVPALVGIATLVALALLGIVVRPALRGLGGPRMEGGETEPRFTRWFAASTGTLSALAVVFQAMPALLLPGCG